MDEFYREQRSGAGRQLLDLLCVALLGLILTLAAGAIARVPAAAAAPGTGGAHGKAAADCDTPAKPDPAVAAARFRPGARARALRGRREAAAPRRRLTRRPTQSARSPERRPCRSCHPIRCGRWGRSARSGLSFVLAIVIGTALGWWLDDTLGTSPICFFIFFFLGLAAGVLNVYRTMSRIK